MHLLACLYFSFTYVHALPGAAGASRWDGQMDRWMDGRVAPGGACVGAFGASMRETV